MIAAFLNSMLTARANCEAVMSPSRDHCVCNVRHAISFGGVPT